MVKGNGCVQASVLLVRGEAVPPGADRGLGHPDRDEGRVSGLRTSNWTNTG